MYDITTPQAILLQNAGRIKLKKEVKLIRKQKFKGATAMQRVEQKNKKERREEKRKIIKSV